MPPKKPLYNRGDIVLAMFPNSDSRTSKLRPALIVQADNLQTGLSQFVVAMISSKMIRAGHPCRVTILKYTPEGIQSGLPVDAVVLTDNLATVADSAIDFRLGSIPMTAVDIALRYTLAL